MPSAGDARLTNAPAGRNGASSGDRRRRRGLRRVTAAARHRTPRRSARRPHRAGRPPPHTAARGCPHCTDRFSGARRHATRYRLKGRTQRRAVNVGERAHGGAHPSKSGPTPRPHAPRATAPGHQAVRYSRDHTEQDRVHTEQDIFRQRTRCGAVSRRYVKATDSALHAHRRPSSGARRVQRLQRLPVRAECNGSERLRTERSSHRAQPTARTHRVRRGQRAVRHPASHGDGHPRTRAECGAPVNLPVPAECNGPGNRPGTHRVKRPGRRAATQRATAAQARNLTGGQRTGDRVVSASQHSRLPTPRKGIRNRRKTFRRPGTRRASTASNSPCGTEKYASRYRQPDPACWRACGSAEYDQLVIPISFRRSLTSGRIRQPPTAFLNRVEPEH